MDTISKSAHDYHEETIRLRRDFHRHPELGLEEHRTGQIVADYLSACGMEISRLNKTGVVGLLRGAFPGPTLLMRADMDALPIQEESECPYKSTIDGVMHACGHDAHTAMLLVAAKILAKRQNELYGNIKFVFQPNEENIGALGMIEEGVLENPRVDACVGVHVWSPLALGTVGVKSGPIMAGMQHFKLVIKGKGGHTAEPHSAIDPIITSSAIIQAVQTIQTRQLDILKEPAIIMFGAINGGSAANIIPDSVSLLGTIRYLHEAKGANAESPLAKFKRIVEGVSALHNSSCELEFSYGHPTLVNSKEMTDRVRVAVEKVSPELKIEQVVTLAGEDFSEFTSRVPGCYYFLGAAKADGEVFPHHHPRFDIDENVLKTGVELHVRTALEFCSQYTKQSNMREQ